MNKVTALGLVCLLGACDMAPFVDAGSSSQGQGGTTSTVGSGGSTTSTGDHGGGGTSSTSTSSTDGGAGGSGGHAGSGGVGGAGGVTGQGGFGGACAPTEKLCAGQCVQADPAHGCDPSSCAPCVIDHAKEACSAGACVMGACDVGYADCNSSAVDGCEQDVVNDPKHCGDCKTACVLSHAIAGCSSGSCTIAACEAEYKDCDNNPENGCESGILKDPMNCGTCGNACDPQNDTCVNGVCAPNPCVPPKADCDGNNTCETTLGMVANCAYCGDLCVTPHAVPICSQGTCFVQNCVGSYQDCDGKAANGCEVDPNSDPTNCGSCGNACTFAHAAATCTSGSCKPGICDVDYADCDLKPETGCEQNVASDVANCGACGKSCALANANAACTTGLCTIAGCAGTDLDCDGKAANGCEVDPTSDSANCSACGNVCAFAHASATCASSACKLGACDVGYADCDLKPETGCEQNVASDVANCGACGHACNVGETCNAGACIGPCGPVTTNAWSVCVHYPHDPAKGAIRLSGAIVPPGGSISQIWGQPMNGCSIPQCTSLDSSSDYFSTSFGKPGIGSYIQIMPLIIQANSVKDEACSDTVCKGEVYVYDPTGKNVGSLQSFVCSGNLAYVLHYSAPAQMDLKFMVN